MSNLLVTQDLAFSYDGVKPVLNGVSFSLSEGEFCCLVGPNGSGKSTFLKAICGSGVLGGKFQGRVYWDGLPIEKWHAREFAKKVAFVPTIVSTTERITVLDFVVQGRYAYSPFWKEASSEDYRVAEEAMNMVGLSKWSEGFLADLSTGLFQLALLARAITQNPKVFVCDETASHLDISFQKKIFLLFQRLVSEGKSVLLVCHDLNTAAEFASTMALFKNGRLIGKGKCEEVLDSQTVQNVFAFDADDDLGITVGTNPISKKPKIFWTT